MPKFNWKEKTGITEIQAAQVLSGVISGLVALAGYELAAMYSAIASQVILAAITAQLQRMAKRKNKPMTDAQFAAGLSDSNGVALAKAAKHSVTKFNPRSNSHADNT